MIIDFKKQFLDIDFDNILVEDNNHLVNSYDYYVQYKKAYVDTTFNVYIKYQRAALELSKLYEIQKVKLSDTKIIYTYINKKRRENLEKKLVELILSQRQRYANFMAYIENLNKIKDTITFDFLQEDIYRNKDNTKTSQSVYSKESIESGKKSKGSIRSVSVYKQKAKKKNIFAKLVSREE